MPSLRPALPMLALAGVLSLAAAPAVGAAGATTSTTAAGPGCVTPTAADGAEPICNPHLADSPWAGNHRSSYAQASSPFAGPTGPAEHVNVDHDGFAAVPVIVSFSPEYPDGGRAIWASTVGATNEILKIDPETVTVIDKYIPQLEEGAAPNMPSVSGAYNLVDADNRLHVGTSAGLEVYGDAIPGKRDSTIQLLRRFELPEEAMCGDDKLVGITMTYEGRIAFATENGVVGTVPRDPDLMDEGNLRLLSLNGDDCAGGPDGAVEIVSNSIAADENGGIYVVTSHAMYRIDDGPDGLSTTWRSSYAGAGGSGGGRLGPGSGSTPSLMGTDADDDRFVVITDGQELMHLTLLWRDEIPADWEPVREGADRRIACEIPVTFGDPEAERSLSEQSVLVRGHSAVVVNNLQAMDPIYSQFPPQAAPHTQYTSGMPGNEPRGLERFAWDPATRTCDVVWSNPDVAIPNGIPTMSVASNMIYGIGARDGVWTLEGIDWDTGEVALTVPTTPFPTSNSTYAATTVGPDGAVWTGTFGGITRFQPCDPATEEDCGRRLDPYEAIIGTIPADPQAAARDMAGLPNDEPEDGAAGGDDGADGAAEGADPADGDTRTLAAAAELPSTGGGASLAAAGLAMTAVALGRRRER